MCKALKKFIEDTLNKVGLNAIVEKMKSMIRAFFIGIDHDDEMMALGQILYILYGRRLKTTVDHLPRSILSSADKQAVLNHGQEFKKWKNEQQLSQNRQYLRASYAINIALRYIHQSECL